MSLLEGVIYNINELRSPFRCDVEICKGACCFIEGSLGAPLKQSELEPIEKSIPKIWEMLPETSRKVIQSKGWFLKDKGNFYTNVVNNKECVFLFFENGVGRCAFERAFFENKIQFRKPISCHLFPLREYSYFFTEIIYVKIPECKSAIENGLMTSTPLLVSLKDALIRRFGQRWYNNLINSESSSPSIETIDDSGGGK